MMAPSHVAIGLAAWVIAAPLLSMPIVQPVSLGLVVAGSLLPDIDHPASWVGRRLRPLSSLLAAVLGHRGVTHSAVAVAVLAVSLVRWRYQGTVVWPLVVGYASHLVADMLTPRGLRLAWPMKRSWGVPLCRTGSPAEGLAVALLVGAAWWTVSHPLPRAEPPAPIPSVPMRTGAALRAPAPRPAQGSKTTWTRVLG